MNTVMLSIMTFCYLTVNQSGELAVIEAETTCRQAITKCLRTKPLRQCTKEYEMSNDSN